MTKLRHAAGDAVAGRARAIQVPLPPADKTLNQKA